MDFFNEEGLLSKSKSKVSSLFEMLWTSRLPSQIKTTKEWPKQLGLRTLTYSSQNPTHSCFILHSYMAPSPSPSPTPSRTSSTSSSVFQSLTHSSSYSYSSSSSVIDDWIGTESGAYMKCNEEELAGIEKPERDYHHDFVSERNQWCAVKKKKQYPPPIPLLARTGNLPGHMPWVLKRHYVDGRLILTEERVKHHEYFEAHRENGRLILKLVPLDDTVRCCHSVYNNKEELEPEDPAFVDEEEEKESQEQEEEETYEVDDGDNGDSMEDTEVGDEHENGVLKTWASSVPKSCFKNGNGRSGDLRKCFSYAGRMMSEINLSCNANAHRNAMDQSGSAPLLFTARPMTTVV